MDDHHFDTLARAIGASASRRGLFVSVGLAPVFSTLGVSRVEAKKRRKKKRKGKGGGNNGWGNPPKPCNGIHSACGEAFLTENALCFMGYDPTMQINTADPFDCDPTLMLGEAVNSDDELVHWQGVTIVNYKHDLAVCDESDVTVDWICNSATVAELQARDAHGSFFLHGC